MQYRMIMPPILNLTTSLFTSALQESYNASRLSDEDLLENSALNLSAAICDYCPALPKVGIVAGGFVRDTLYGWSAHDLDCFYHRSEDWELAATALSKAGWIK